MTQNAKHYRAFIRTYRGTGILCRILPRSWCALGTRHTLYLRFPIAGDPMPLARILSGRCPKQ